MPAMDVEPAVDADKLQDNALRRVNSPLRKVEHPDGTVVLNSEQKPAAIADLLQEKAARRRKKNKGKGMAPADPATNVIRGFETPTASGGEESDISRVASPLLRPQVGGYPMSREGSNNSGISALKQQLDSLALDTESTRPSLTRMVSNGASGFDSTASMSSAASDSDRTETETYEINLEHDFVSPDIYGKTSSRLGPVEGGLRPGSVVRKMTCEDFEPLRCLGKGAFGTVHLVKQRATGRLFAQKQFRKASLTVHKRLVEQTRTERNILESVNRNNAFICRLYYAFQDQEKLYLILEYASGGELFTHLAIERMFSEEVASFYMAEMVLALEHLHKDVRVVYRDLKPENCLLDAEGHLLLTDFGLSKIAVEDEACNSVLGTIEYMAPEVITGTNYGMAVDWWSLGAIGFDLLTGSPPFQGNNHAKIQQNILKQKLSLPYFLGPDAKDLLTRLLRKDPSKRLGYSEPKDIQVIKKHRFFRKIDWKKLSKREVEPPIVPLITDPELAENFAKEFTDLALSPTVDKKIDMVSPAPVSLDSNPFGGFSFVASQSLLEREDFLMMDG